MVQSLMEIRSHAVQYIKKKKNHKVPSYELLISAWGPLSLLPPTLYHLHIGAVVSHHLVCNVD